MDLFDASIKEELGDDYMDLMQIIDDYLERPNRSSVQLLTTAQKLIEQVEQQTSDIETATQLFTEPTVAQAEASNSNTVSQTVELETTKSTDDDDVVYVSSESVEPPIIDLLTPNYSRRRNKRRRLQPDEVITLDDSSSPTKSPKRADIQPTPSLASSLTPPSESGGLKLKCCVCMDDPLKREPTSTICGHIFCKKCIHEAIRCSKKCPLCNKKINSTSKVHRVYV